MLVLTWRVSSMSCATRENRAAIDIMTPTQLRRVCMKLPGATEQIQWGNNRVFKIGGKMFACSGTEKTSCYSFKVEDHRFLELTDLDGIVPAPYLARARWVQINPANCRLPNPEIEALVKQSYELVFGKLPKKTQHAIREAS